MKFEKDNTSAVVPVEQKPFDIGETKAMVLANAQANQAEILALTDKLDLTNSQSLVTFGKEAVDEVSKCSDIILNNVEMDKITGAGDLVRALTTIMDKFDVKELVFDENDKLSLKEDPKILAAREMDIFPVEINYASYKKLIRVPGIGPKSARKIMAIRKNKPFKKLEELQRIGVVVKRAEPYIKLDGNYQSALDNY